MSVPVFPPNRAKTIGAAEAPRVCTDGKPPGVAGALRSNSIWQACALSTMIFGAALIVWPQAGLAQSNNTIGTGSVVRPVASLPLRDAPPEGLLGAKGDVVGQASTNRDYRILDQRTISTILGRQMWLNVQDTTSRQIGWVYSGSDDRPFQNVTQQKPQ